jgi:hypothetical protein
MRKTLGFQCGRFYCGVVKTLRHEKELRVLGQSLTSPGYSGATVSTPRWQTFSQLMVVVIFMCGGFLLAPQAFADSAADLIDAVAAARSGTSCKPLSDNPVVGQVAAIINKSTDDYLEHVATQVPLADPLPGLKDLGYPGDKAVVLQGARPIEADAIKGTLLEGFAAIPDCSYTDFGVDVRRNESTGYSLVSVVLAGA